MLNSQGLSAPDQARQARLSVLAKAPAGALQSLWQLWCDQVQAPAYEVLRAPEIGTTMVRGRAGAVGAAFNLGEITVTRCAIRLNSGHVGHGYVQGRDKTKALTVAQIDAVAQAGNSKAIDAAITKPLQIQLEAKHAERGAKAAATKVEFFTMVRGDT